MHIIIFDKGFIANHGTDELPINEGFRHCLIFNMNIRALILKLLMRVDRCRICSNVNIFK